jgi:hypothetical protein
MSMEAAEQHEQAAEQYGHAARHDQEHLGAFLHQLGIEP